MKRTTWILVMAFAVLYVLRVYWAYESDSKMPTAVDGIIDLRQWDAAAGKIAGLKGEWRFYPNVFLDPGRLTEAERAEAARERNIEVPGGWDKAVSPDDPTPFGYGTYRLTVLLPRQEVAGYGIHVQTIRTAHKLYADGALIGQQGNPGADRTSSEPLVQIYDAAFVPTGDRAEIVIHASNFHYGRLGGIFEQLEFGEEKAVERNSQLRGAIDNLWIGFFMASGAFLLLLFLYRRQNRELLYFSLFFWMVLLFWVTHGERLLFWMFPDLALEWRTKLQALSTLGQHLALLLFVHEVFPNRRHKKIVAALVTATGACMTLILFGDAVELSRYELPMIFLNAVSLLLICYILIFNGLKHQDGKSQGLNLMPLAALCILLDTATYGLHYLGIKSVNTYFPVERVVFALAMALMIAQRFFHNMNQVEVLSKRLLTADRLKSDFLINTSQEIGQPLQGMINLAQVMLDEGSLKEQRHKERLSLLVATGRRLAHLLNDLMDLSKLDDGDFALQLRAVDMRMTINAALEVMQYMAGGMPVRYENRTEPGLPYVLGDERRLMQILFSLLHYTNRTGMPETVSVLADASDGRMEVRIEAVVEAAGEKEPPAESVESADFGLEVSRKLIAKHGGEFRTDGVTADGLIRLSFTLPLADAATALDSRQEEPEAREEPSDPHPKEPTAERIAADNAPRVLIVDDDPVTLQIMSDLLAQEGLKVTAATDGLQGLRKWEKEPGWELVVMNVVLPRISGYDLCRKIRERHSFYDLPVLFLTSRNQPADLVVGYNVGGNDFVGRPIDAAEFRARVRTLLRMKESVRHQLNTEMALIQAQIKPHFLYNTLNTIASLSEIDPDRTRELLTDFGNYLRSCFDTRNLDRLVPFAKEWLLVHSYLQIEQARFGSRITVTTDIAEAPQFELPPLSIQPIVENALRHGILTRFEGGHVHIGVTADSGGYRIAVRDDGVGFPPGKKETVLSGSYRSGIGLLNVHRRLLNAYGEGLEIHSVEGEGTEICFRIPTKQPAV